MCRAVRDLNSLGLLWLVTWQKGQKWLWLTTFMLFKMLHYHPSYYQLYFHPAVQWPRFTSAPSTTDVCFRHILAAHRQKQFKERTECSRLLQVCKTHWGSLDWHTHFAGARGGTSNSKAMPSALEEFSPSFTFVLQLSLYMHEQKK